MYEFVVAPVIAVVPLYHCHDVPVPEVSVSVTLLPEQNDVGPLGVITGTGNAATVIVMTPPPVHPAVLETATE